MAGISSKAAGSLENKKKFISQEIDYDLGLNLYQFKWRNHDPQIGRFIEVDPVADKYVYNTPYAYAENRVIDGFDLEGLEFWRAVGSYMTGNSAAGSVFPNEWASKKTSQYQGAIASAARLSTETTQNNASHVPGMESAVRITNKLRDIASVVDAVGDAYRLTFAVAAAIPVGEAGAASVAVQATFKLAGEGGSVALNSQGKTILGKITSDAGVRNSFSSGEFTIVQAETDINAVRIFGNKSGEKGSFLGFISPKSSAEAESMYYLKAYGNDASFSTPVTIKKGTQMAIGRVNGGTGSQIYIPAEVQGSNVTYLSGQTKILQ